MNVLGVIPARGGSQRIPRKNIALCAGRPLLSYTCEAALGSRLLTRTVLSTEDEEIAAMARNEGMEVLVRPGHLAQAETPMAPVLLDVLERLGEPDALVLLQPTSPLRTSRHIDEAVSLFLDQSADSVVSVRLAPHIFHPLKLQRLHQGRLVPYLPEGAQSAAAATCRRSTPGTGRPCWS